MRYYLCGISDTGNYRNKNEDCFLIDHTVINKGFFESKVSSPFITAVCDGVACEKSGEVASKIASETLSSLEFNSHTNMFNEVINIHNKIGAYGELSPLKSRNMQTTMCCLTVDENDNACCVNVGDSRMYRYCDGNLFQISTDQTLVEFLHSQGKITHEEAKNHKQKNVIFPVLGNVKHDPSVQIKPLKMKISGNDVVIICSDGFSDYVSEEEIQIGMSLDIPLKEKITTLAELATERGSTDNITIVAVQRIYEPKTL